MDELMNTKIFRTIISKLLTKMVRKSFGDDVKIYVKDLTVDYDKTTNKINIHTDIYGETTPETIQAIVFKSE